MLKHYIDIFTNTYIIEDNGVIVFSIDLSKEPENPDHVRIRSANSDYKGNVRNIVVSSLEDEEFL